MSDWENRNLDKVVRKLLDSYAAKGVDLDIKKRLCPIDDDRLRLDVKVLPQTRVADIRRHADDVRRSLKLALLDVVEDPDVVYIIISKKRPRDEYFLPIIYRSQEYATAYQSMGLAYPVGINQSGSPVIVDLLDPHCPHIIVSGTSGSGKSVALKCLLITLVTYYLPDRVNLLIGDKANDLSQFTDLPHLSYPLIEDFNTLLSVLLLLKEEMDHRIYIKNTSEFEQYPVIVCVIDEFNSFMAEASDQRKAALAVDTITQLLRMGRHARIHFVLAAHDPTSTNMRIKTSDLPVKMVFQVSNLHNSVTALGEGGAEKLRGQGDMLLKMNGKIQNLQGAFISNDEIDIILRVTCQRFRREYGIDNLTKDQESLCWQSLRGEYGFTVSDMILEHKTFQIQEELSRSVFEIGSRRSIKNNSDQIFAEVVKWTLNQDEISCNQISENFRVGWRRANSYIVRLYDWGIVGDLDAKLPRKVLLHSVEELPQDIAKLLKKI